MISEVLATILLTIAFIPGAICKIPKNASKLLVTCVHALLFTIAYMLMRTYLFDGVIESMVSKEDPKPTKGGEMSEETKISTVLSKLSVEQTKELSQLSLDELTELAKLVIVMEDKQVDRFLDMSIDKIKEMIKETGEKIEDVM